MGRERNLCAEASKGYEIEKAEKKGQEVSPARSRKSNTTENENGLKNRDRCTEDGENLNKMGRRGLR